MGFFVAGRNFKFYDNSQVCIGLPLALIEISTKYSFEPVIWDAIDFYFFSSYSVADGVVVGSYYSVVLFLGINCICYLVILFCYIGIICEARKTTKNSGRTQSMDEQVKMTTRVTAIVATDFFCWFPIIILGILVQTRTITLPPLVYAWLVTCVLPINSAINPYLYTIAEVILNCRKKAREASMQQNYSTNAAQTSHSHDSIAQTNI